jgi:hypothetical protein
VITSWKIPLLQSNTTPDAIYRNRLKLLAKLEELLGNIITNSRLSEITCWEYFVGQDYTTLKAMSVLGFTNSG